jgi:hypothetical protein
MVNSGVDPNCLDENRLNAARIFAKKLSTSDEEMLSSSFIVHANTTFITYGTDLMEAASDGTTLANDLLILKNEYPEKLSDLSAYIEAIPEIAAKLKPFDRSRLLSERFSVSPLLRPMFPELPRLLDRKRMIIGNEMNIRGTAGMTPLWLAVHCNLEQEAKFLIRRGADTDLKLTDDLRRFAAKTDEIYGFRGEDDGYFGVRGETVVMAACTNPYWRSSFIPLLIAATKDPNQTDHLGRNLLHKLLYHPLLIGQEHLINDLIRAGVNSNAQTISGSTPTHVAVALNPKAIPVLVKSGADPSIRDMHNRTVEDLLSIAIGEGWPRQDDYHQTIAWLRQNQK